jgi:hypothetical protein
MTVEEYHQHFMRPYFSLPEYRQKVFRKKNNLSIEFDKLFFYFLSLIKYPVPYVYTKHEETLIKYNICEKLESFKYKHKKVAVHCLCFEKNIDLKTLDCLAKYYCLNLIYSNMKIYVSMEYGTTMVFYHIDSNMEYHLCKQSMIDHIKENFYCIEDVHKPLYSLSHYKVEELKEIATKLNLNGTETYKKKDYYDQIQFYLQNALI